MGAAEAASAAARATRAAARVKRIGCWIKAGVRVLVGREAGEET